MEGNLSSGNMNLAGSSYGGLDLQSPIRPHHQHRPQISLNQQHQSLFRQGSIVQPINENAPLTMGSYGLPMSLSDFSKGEKGKGSASEEDEPSFTEDMFNGHDDMDKGRKGVVPWQRVKWADKMVRLLITAVSYIGEDANENGNSLRRRCANIHKKGKWKSISKVMSERGHSVSPQQCEDKFNDLNKRYKRLNEILGRGTSCQVVEQPELLEMIPNLSEKAKDEVKKILSSKQLFYEEMCSYHNKNDLHLPRDPELQHSLRLALRNRDEHEHNDFNEDDRDAEVDNHDEYEENNSKKMKPCLGHGNFNMKNSPSFSEFNKNFSSQAVEGDINQPDGEGQSQWIERRMIQLEEQRLQIQAQMLELDRERFKWDKFCRKGDRELEMMRVENEKMKLENDRMSMELKRKDLEMRIGQN